MRELLKRPRGILFSVALAFQFLPHARAAVPSSHCGYILSHFLLSQRNLGSPEEVIPHLAMVKSFRAQNKIIAQALTAELRRRGFYSIKEAHNAILDFTQSNDDENRLEFVNLVAARFFEKILNKTDPALKMTTQADAAFDFLHLKLAILNFIYDYADQPDQKLIPPPTLGERFHRLTKNNFRDEPRPLPGATFNAQVEAAKIVESKMAKLRDFSLEHARFPFDETLAMELSDIAVHYASLLTPEAFSPFALDVVKLADRTLSDIRYAAFLEQLLRIVDELPCLPQAQAKVLLAKLQQVAVEQSQNGSSRLKITRELLSSKRWIRLKPVPRNFESTRPRYIGWDA